MKRIRMMMVLLGVGCTSSLSAWGQSSPQVNWICWLGSQTDYNIHCVKETDPVLDATEDAASEPYDDARMQAEFWQAGKPRNVGRLVREQPERYQRIMWSIPLYSMPFDPEDVRLLARTIMCGVDVHCNVELSPPERHAMRD